MAPGTASCTGPCMLSGPSSGAAEKPDNSSSTLTLPPPSPPETITSRGPSTGITAVGNVLASISWLPPPLNFFCLGTAPALQAKQPQPMAHLNRQSPE